MLHTITILNHHDRHLPHNPGVGALGLCKVLRLQVGDQLPTRRQVMIGDNQETGDHLLL